MTTMSWPNTFALAKQGLADCKRTQEEAEAKERQAELDFTVACDALDAA